MIRYLTLAEVLKLHDSLIATSGGAPGLRDLGRLESAIAQPKATFDGEDLYTSAVEKAAAFGFALIQGHPFIDGNKRIGHASMAVFLRLNELEIDASVDEQEQFILSVASGKKSRDEVIHWLKTFTTPLSRPAR